MASRHRRIESTPDRLFPFEEMAARGPRPEIYAIFGRAEFSSNGALPYSATHRAYRKLSAFDDRMLKDIGLHRSHIQMIANGTDGARRKAA